MKTQKLYIFPYSFILVISLFLEGCSTKFENISVQDDFLTQQGVSIGLIWVKGSIDMKNTAQHYLLGDYLLGKPEILDIAINQKLSNMLSESLEKINLQDEMKDHFFNLFKQAYENSGFNVKVDATPYCWKSIHRKMNINSKKPINRKIKPLCEKTLDLAKGDEMKILQNNEVRIELRNFDYQPIIREMDVDYLFVIVLYQHGTGRTYFTAIPTSPPKAITSLISYLIDGNGNIISQHLSSVLELAQGEWEDPPAYVNLMKAANLSLEKAMDDVFIDVFKQAP